MMTVIDALPYVVMSAAVGVIFMHYRAVQSGKLVPRSTVDLINREHADQMKAARASTESQLTAMRDDITSRMDNFRGDHNVRLTEMRADHAQQMAEIRDAYQRIIAAKDSELDKLYASWNLEAEANRQTVNASQEQVTAAAQLVTTMAQSLQEARRRMVEAGNDGSPIRPA
jgi:uncharacterized protein YukE